jgi:membrane protein
MPAAGWRGIFKRAWAEAGRDHISLIAAGVAFYGLLALFPAITALVAIAGLMLEPSQVTAQIEQLSRIMPDSAAEIVISQATEVAGSREGGLGLAALLGIGLAIYSSSKGVSSIMEGLNVAYDEEDNRGFVKRTALTLALTFGLIVGVTFGLGAVVVLPGVLSVVQLGDTTELLIGALRWVVMLALVIVGIAILYRFGPDRSSPQWRWLTPGAVLACIAWIIASVGFAIYVNNFGSYNESFGTLAGVIVLLMWMWISAYIVLLGAEVNSEAELQTREDTTVGPEMPMGARGAVKADTPPPEG